MLASSSHLTYILTAPSTSQQCQEAPTPLTYCPPPHPPTAQVFEKLGPSLYDYLRRNEYQPLPLALVQAIAHQLLVAVAYIHELGLVHTDLKPENILMQTQDHMKLPAVPPAA